MELANITTKYVCGVDLHGKTKYICVMDKSGNILLHRNMKNDFDSFKDYISPYLPNISVGVESMHSYYWLSDSCLKNNIPFYLGHAYYMKSIHGGKTKNDKIDSKKIADLLRSNHFPVGYVYPKELRSTRDLLRRRIRFMKIRAEAYAHIQTIFRQHCLNISPKDVKNKQERRLLINRIDDQQIKSSIELNLNVIDFFDAQLNKVEREIRAKAKLHDRTSLNILLSIPGVGDMMSLVILYEIGDISRFPSPQKFSSYARLVKCERSSAGKKYRGGNNKIGNPYLKWAIGEIIIHAPTFSPYIKSYYDRLINRSGNAKAKAIITHKFGVAIYNMLKNKTSFDEKKFVETNMKH
jgi:transposase